MEMSELGYIAKYRLQFRRHFILLFLLIIVPLTWFSFNELAEGNFESDDSMQWFSFLVLLAGTMYSSTLYVLLVFCKRHIIVYNEHLVKEYGFFIKKKGEVNFADVIKANEILIPRSSIKLFSIETSGKSLAFSDSLLKKDEYSSLKEFIFSKVETNK